MRKKKKTDLVACILEMVLTHDRPSVNVKGMNEQAGSHFIMSCSQKLFYSVTRTIVVLLPYTKVAVVWTLLELSHSDHLGRDHREGSWF